jgi:hypothetical protein
MRRTTGEDLVVPRGADVVGGEEDRVAVVAGPGRVEDRIMGPIRHSQGREDAGATVLEKQPDRLAGMATPAVIGTDDVYEYQMPPAIVALPKTKRRRYADRCLRSQELSQRPLASGNGGRSC